jgi:hypothetical protein
MALIYSAVTDDSLVGVCMGGFLAGRRVVLFVFFVGKVLDIIKSEVRDRGQGLEYRTAHHPKSVFVIGKAISLSPVSCILTVWSCG